METMQLNLSAPLMSVRQYRNSFPGEESDEDLGEVVQPGAVPFAWEEVPGRPKIHNSEEPPANTTNTLRLPPGVVKSGELSEDDEPRDVSVKSCGFFPWFRSSNPLRLLNPVPAVKVKAKSALAFASKVGRLVKNASYRKNSKVISTNHTPHEVDDEPNGIQCMPESNSRPMSELPAPHKRRSSVSPCSTPYRNYKRSTVSPFPTRARHFSQLPRKPLADNTNLQRSSKELVLKRDDPATQPPPPPPLPKFRSQYRLSRNLNALSPRTYVSHSHVGNTDKTLYIIKARGMSKPPLPPPLPTFRSQYRLSRNLNAFSPRNCVSHFHVGNKVQTRHQTIVKTSNLRYHHKRYSEELVARQSLTTK